jgi:hypothetical protein
LCGISSQDFWIASAFISIHPVFEIVLLASWYVHPPFLSAPKVELSAESALHQDILLTGHFVYAIPEEANMEESVRRSVDLLIIGLPG